MQTLIKKGDVVVIIAALFLLGYLYNALWGPTSLGTTATILINGKAWKKFSLKQDQIIDVRGKVGTSRIQVKDGLIRFVDSPCNTKQCILQGWLKYAGELAVCLPNRISVQVVGRTPRYDSITF